MLRPSIRCNAQDPPENRTGVSLQFEPKNCASECSGYIGMTKGDLGGDGASHLEDEATWELHHVPTMHNGLRLR